MFRLDVKDDVNVNSKLISCGVKNMEAYELRKKYIPKYYWNRPSMFKLVELLNSTNIKLLRNISIYIFQAFKSRTEQVYGP